MKRPGLKRPLTSFVDNTRGLNGRFFPSPPEPRSVNKLKRLPGIVSTGRCGRGWAGAVNNQLFPLGRTGLAVVQSHRWKTVVFIQSEHIVVPENRL